MAMLSPHEVSAGRIADAPAEGLTLVLPRTSYEEPMLVAGIEDRKMAVFLTGQFRLEAFECSSNDALEGMSILGVSIELDGESIFDPGSGSGATLGCLIRRDTVLNIMATVRDGTHGFRRAQPVTLLNGLPACSERQAVAFRKWRVVLGEGDDKRELFAVTIPEPKEN
jgi:hypothetical protein